MSTEDDSGAEERERSRGEGPQRPEGRATVWREAIREDSRIERRGRGGQKARRQRENKGGAVGDGAIQNASKGQGRQRGGSTDSDRKKNRDGIVKEGGESARVPVS